MMNKFKKVLTGALAAAMLMSLAACGSKTAETSPAADASASAATTSASTDKIDTTNVKTVTAGKLTMSTNAKFPPYEMVKDDGSFEGIDVEIAQKVAEKLGLELVVDDMRSGSLMVFPIWMQSRTSWLWASSFRR